MQICIYGERKIQDNYRYSICSEYAGGVLQFISISEDNIQCAMFSIDIIYMLHADTNSYLLLVWKRSETKGMTYVYFGKLEYALLYIIY